MWEEIKEALKRDPEFRLTALCFSSFFILLLFAIYQFLIAPKFNLGVIFLTNPIF